MYEIKYYDYNILEFKLGVDGVTMIVYNGYMTVFVQLTMPWKGFCLNSSLFWKKVIKGNERTMVL